MASSVKLLDQVRNELRLRRISIRTEEAYVQVSRCAAVWIDPVYLTDGLPFNSAVTFNFFFSIGQAS